MKRRGGTSTKGEEGLPLHRDSPRKHRNVRGARRSWARLGIIFLICLVGGGLYMWKRIQLKETPSTIGRTYFVPKTASLSNVRKSDWKGSPLIHIVKTRFMQEQGHLSNLAQARLALFKVFCLPTMIRQSASNFLWIIKTDPALDPVVFSTLIDELQGLDHVYLVASNRNFRVNEDFPGAWRDGAEISDLRQSRIYTGNRTLLEQAMALEADLPILETRLDADDGLHYDYLEQVQAMAVHAWQKQPNLPWMYWCSRRHVEWHWVEDDGTDGQAYGVPDERMWNMFLADGAFAGVRHSKLCITPGLTVGFGVGVKEADVPVYAHDTLIKNLAEVSQEDACGYTTDPVDCVQFVENRIFEAIRSRSPTSAGMMRVGTAKEEIETTWWNLFAFVNLVYESFGIHREHLKWMNQYLSEYLIEIAQDNLKGQCTTGHSCKEKARKNLEVLIQQREEANQLKAKRLALNPA